MRDSPAGTSPMMIGADPWDVRDGSVRLLVARQSTGAIEAEEFDSVLAAFYRAARHGDLESAELWQDEFGLCKLHKIDTDGGSFWQLMPLAGTDRS